MDCVRCNKKNIEEKKYYHCPECGDSFVYCGETEGYHFYHHLNTNSISKTYEGWEKSCLDLSEYLYSPCEIDSDLFYYLLDCVPAAYCENGIIQGGDAEFKRGGVQHYNTLYEDRTTKRFYYLGILPEFKQYENNN